ncbi:hypothetical protein HK097_009177 [Rhizophlyctis rosea]|uniref:Serine/threonine-protein kinase Chk2 n=1 Tax=Rhizophlyctis rosea TaxID=64517 RepID=A0AAD5SJ70_9FUNG|nr:hypothetical protein HK097_009177 [Rhizophlyctis rosea]
MSVDNAEEDRGAQAATAPNTEDPNVWGVLQPRSSDGELVNLKDKLPGTGQDGAKRGGGYLFGRHNECDETVYNDDTALHEEAVFLEDMSTNGVFINGTKLGRGKQYRLKHGDEIQLFRIEKGKGMEFDNNFASYIFQLPERMRKPRGKDSKSVHDRYAMSKNLGSGNFATVKEAIDRRTGDKVAIKVINKSRFAVKPKFMENLRQEISILMSIRHENIIRIEDVFDEPDNVYIILELVHGGELFDAIIDHQKFSEDVTRSIMLQIFNALKYLHDRGITHRDLKPENILLVSKTPDDWRIKLSDFGLAKLAGEQSFMKTLCGTPNYVAPEVLSHSVGRAYTKAVDLWSCGVILYICLCGFPPFSEELAPPSMTDQIKQGKYTYISPFWDEISPSAKELIDGLLTVDPRRRLTVDQAMQHEWMQMSTSNAIRSESFSSSVPVHAFTRGDTLLQPPKRTKGNTQSQTPQQSQQSEEHSRESTPPLDPNKTVVATNSLSATPGRRTRRSSRPPEGADTSSPPTRATTPDLSETGNGNGGPASGVDTPTGRGRRRSAANKKRTSEERERTPELGNPGGEAGLGHTGGEDGTPRRSKRIRK